MRGRREFLTTVSDTRVRDSVAHSGVGHDRAVPAVVVAAMLLAGCVTERTKPGPVTVREGALAGAVPAASQRAERGSAAVVAAERAAERPPAPAAARATPAAVVRTPPAGSAAAPPAHRPLAAGRTLEDVARERFLEATTTIDAEKATITVPARYAAEATLSGTTTREDGPGRRVAEGVAVLSLRRLTVRARRIVLVARDDGGSDVQISARGNVVLKSDQPASVVEETGLRSLLLTNDGYVPLR
jgi:outer membrane murein-binding lipoprotein Lpp